MKQRHFRKQQALMSHNAYRMVHRRGSAKTSLISWQAIVAKHQAEILRKVADKVFKQFMREQLGNPFNFDMKGFSLPTIDDAPKIPMVRTFWDYPEEIAGPTHINPRKDDNHEQ